VAIPPVPETLSFECPRCRSAIEQRFYGPCPACRAELRQAFVSEARAIERSPFEPAMHVTPNAVALKE
jgi:hypothetical protein